MSIEETLKERGSRYGTFEANADTTQSLMKVLAKGKSFPKMHDMHKEILHMICHKMGRMVNGDPNYIDNVHDIIGYAKGLEDYLIKWEKNNRPTDKPLTCC